MAITHLLILADEMADLCFLVLPSSDHEWQLHISIVISHIGRRSGRYIPLVLPSSDYEWQLHISTVITHIDR